MAVVPEITELFARLASHLQATSSSRHDAIEEDEQAIQLSVLDLSRSLNLEDGSRVRVLDTALSLMCFRAPQVFDSIVKYSMETIVGVLSSSIGCKVLRLQKDEILVIGSSISRRDCLALIENFSDVLANLEGYGPQYECVLQAVLRVLISSSSYRILNPTRLIHDANSADARSTTISKFLGSFPEGFSFGDSEIPFRLQSWFLDPLTLKHDISNILRESTKRPFFCLCREFHERMDWRSIAKCFALSPIMFIETRALLHRWFLLTGLVSVLELLVGLCSVILDVISRPTWWDISMELGAQLPFSNAYFPHQHHLLRILSGPLSHASLLQLVHLTGESFPCNGTQNDPIMKSTLVHSETIDHKSSWALAISFPCWFYYASALLFSEKSFQGNNISESQASNIVKTHYMESPSATAARYIAWIMNPISQSDQDLLADYLVKISKSLASKQLGAGTHEMKTASNRKILEKPKFCEQGNKTRPEKYGCQIIALWLEELKSFHSQSNQQNAFFRRLPLGILLGCLGYIDGDGSELLLHFATTERIIQLKKDDATTLKRIKRDRDGRRDIIPWIDECSKEEAVAGAQLVFSLTDNAESMSASLFDTDEAGLHFICQVKTMVGKYLIKCIQRQIKLKVHDGNLVAMDLCQRLKQWKHQGQRILEIHKDVDDILAVLSNKFLPYEEIL